MRRPQKQQAKLSCAPVVRAFVQHCRWLIEYVHSPRKLNAEVRHHHGTSKRLSLVTGSNATLTEADGHAPPPVPESKADIKGVYPRDGDDLQRRAYLFMVESPISARFVSQSLTIFESIQTTELQAQDGKANADNVVLVVLLRQIPDLPPWLLARPLRKKLHVLWV